MDARIGGQKFKEKYLCSQKTSLQRSLLITKEDNKFMIKNCTAATITVGSILILTIIMHMNDIIPRSMHWQGQAQCHIFFQKMHNFKIMVKKNNESQIQRHYTKYQPIGTL